MGNRAKQLIDQGKNVLFAFKKFFWLHQMFVAAQEIIVSQGMSFAEHGLSSRGMWV